MNTFDFTHPVKSRAGFADPEGLVLQSTMNNSEVTVARLLLSESFPRYVC